MLAIDIHRIKPAVRLVLGILFTGADVPTAYKPF